MSRITDELLRDPAEVASQWSTRDDEVEPRRVRPYLGPCFCGCGLPAVGRGLIVDDQGENGKLRALSEDCLEEEQGRTRRIQRRLADKRRDDAMEAG